VKVTPLTPGGVNGASLTESFFIFEGVAIIIAVCICIATASDFDRFELSREIIYFSLISGPIWVIPYAKFIIYMGASNGTKIIA
jgi:hypothetical protein